MSSTGEAFDYAMNDCGISGSRFIKILTGSSICSKIENGELAYLAGKSGIEIARECVKNTTGKELDIEPQMHYNRSPEYWCGWAVAILSVVLFQKVQRNIPGKRGETVRKPIFES